MATQGTPGQSAWHHAVSTYGDMGQQHAGVGNSIAMKGGKRRRQSQSKKQSRRQRQTWGKRQRQSRRQRGGRK
jgi:hypothetical protein